MAFGKAPAEGRGRQQRSKGDQEGSARPKVRPEPPGSAVRSWVLQHSHDGREGRERAGDKPRGRGEEL